MKNLLKMFQPDKTSVSIDNPTEKEKKTSYVAGDRVDEKLKKYQKLDDAAKEFYHTYEPNVQIEHVGNKTFVRLGDQEFIAEYCTDIQVKDLGEAPSASYYSQAYGGESINIYCASNATITANMVSGRTVDFICNRHAVEVVYAALQTAHREASKLD